MYVIGREAKMEIPTGSLRQSAINLRRRCEPRSPRTLPVTIKRQELYIGVTKSVAVSVLLAATARCNLSASDSCSYPDSRESELRKNEEDNLKKQIRAIPGLLQAVKSAAAAILFSGLLATSFYLASPHEQSEAQTAESAPASRPPIGVTTSTQNPLQIAILHWYDPNLTTQFTPGTAPYPVPFDASTIWQPNNTTTQLTNSLQTHRTV